MNILLAQYYSIKWNILLETNAFNVRLPPCQRHLITKLEGVSQQNERATQYALYNTSNFDYYKKYLTTKSQILTQ